MSKKKIWYTAILLVILTLAFFLRSYHIETLPPGVYPDEAVNGEDALRALNTKHFQWFYQANQGREGLFINIIALCFHLFGISILTLRLPAIIFSTLSILGTYFLTKEMFNRRMALITSFLICFSFWSINFGRISFRANMLPAILAFSFYFVFKGLRTKKWWHFAIGGAIFGLGMHSYIAWRIAPAILIIFAILLMFFRKKFIKEYWQFMLFFLATSIIVAAPMFYTFKIHPEYFGSRSESISIFSPTLNGGSVIKTFLRTFSLSLIKYNFVGDMNWRHNFPPYAILDPISGTAFLFGLIYSTLFIFKALRKRIFEKVKTPELEKYSFLIIWFFIMLAPEFLTAEGNPHALRSIGTLPAVFIFAGITFEYLFNIPRKSRCLSRKTILIIVTSSLAFISVFNTMKYHILWANKESVAISFDKNLTEISRYISLLPINQERFIVTSNNVLEKVPIEIFHTETRIRYLFPNEINQINPSNKNDFIVIFTESNIEAIQSVKSRFSYLQYQIIENSPGSIFYVLKTN